MLVAVVVAGLFSVYLVLLVPEPVMAVLVAAPGMEQVAVAVKDQTMQEAAVPEHPVVLT